MTDGPSAQSPRPSPSVGCFVLALLGVVVLQFVYGAAVFFLFGPQMATRGQFGDIFGGVNALFTGLAFAGVIYTILLQRRELELQRDELRLTREELRRSAEAQTDQVAQLKEAANLSALTALLNVYSTDLQPLREITRDTRRDLASMRAFQQREDLSAQQRSDVGHEVVALEKRIVEQEAEWSTLLDKHHALVVRLEALVERVAAGHEQQNPAPPEAEEGQDLDPQQGPTV